MSASKTQQGIRSLCPIGRRVLSCFPESRASSPVAATWEDKHCNSRRPPPSSASQLLLLSKMPCGMGFPCGQRGSAVPAVPCLSFWRTLPLLASRAAWETEKALTLRKCCSTTAKTSACHERCFGHKSKAQHHTAPRKKINSSKPHECGLMLLTSYSNTG